MVADNLKVHLYRQFEECQQTRNVYRLSLYLPTVADYYCQHAPIHYNARKASGAVHA